MFKTQDELKSFFEDKFKQTRNVTLLTDYGAFRIEKGMNDYFEIGLLNIN